MQDRMKTEFKERYGNDLTDEELRLAARNEMVDKMKVQLSKEGKFQVVLGCQFGI